MKTIAVVCVMGLSLASWAQGLFLDEPMKSVELARSVVVQEREILTDSFSRTLYVFDPDQAAGKPSCAAICAEKWPPYIVSAAEAETLPAPFGVAKRDTNLLQLTYNNRPVYTFFLDRSVGDILGEGLGNVWHTIEVQRLPWGF